MRCPRCATDISDRVERCPACSFTLAELDPVAGPIPARTGAVTDVAGALFAEDRTALERRAARLHQRTGAELAVLVVRQAPLPPPQYVFWVFNRWDVGGAENRGLLLLLAIEDRRVEVEVGYGLEHIVDDETSAAILDEHVVPLLREGAWGAGLLLGADVLCQILEGGERPPFAARLARWLPGEKR